MQDGVIEYLSKRSNLGRSVHARRMHQTIEERASIDSYQNQSKSLVISENMAVTCFWDNNQSPLKDSWNN